MTIWKLKHEMIQRYRDFLEARDHLDNIAQLEDNLRYQYISREMVINSILELDETGYRDAGYKEYVKKQKANSDLNFIDDDVNFDDERNGDYET